MAQVSLPALVSVNLSLPKDIRSDLLSKSNINGVYIPSALVIIGVAIMKIQWLPYAVVFASLVGGYKIFATGTTTLSLKLVPTRPH